MSATTGGVTIKTLSGRSASGLCDYRNKKVSGYGVEKESYLFASTRHCSHDTETLIEEWKATRVKHGTDGAVRATRGKYETVDPQTGLHANGEPGTHVKVYGKNGQARKRPIKAGETPTHVYIPPNELTPFERESEAQHTIYAAGADLVDPNDVDACQRFFEAVEAERDEHYPGLQESMWLERNGESGLAHVHVASNATIYADFELDGVQYRAGQKLRGDLTNIDRIRSRFETYLDEHQEHGFTQALARVGTPEYAAAQTRDGQLSYWESRRGREPAQDYMRRASAEVMAGTACTDRAGFIEELKGRGVEVRETGLRRGKPGKNHDYAYKLADGKQAIRGTTLGEMYSYTRVGEQLDLKAAGREIDPYPQRQVTGPAVESTPEAEEVAELRRAVAELADSERADQRAERDEQRAERDEQRAAQWAEERQQDRAQYEAGLERLARVVTDEPSRDAPSLDIQPASDDTLDALREEFPEELAEFEAERMARAPRGEASDYAALTLATELETRVERGALRGDLETIRERHVQEAAEKAAAEAAAEREAAEAAEREAEERAQAEPEEKAAAEAAEAEQDTAEEEPLPFRSQLRGVKAKGGSEKTQARIDGVAQVEEDYRDQPTDAAFATRLKQLGVGPQFIQHYGEHLSPEMRETLIARRDKSGSFNGTRETWIENKDRIAELSQGRDAYDIRQSVMWGRNDEDAELKELHWQDGHLTRKLTRLRDELDNGVYEADTPAAQQEAKDLERHEAARRSEQGASKGASRGSSFAASVNELRDDRAGNSAREDQDQGMDR